MKTNAILALLAIVGGLSAAFTNHASRNHLYPTWKYEKERVAGQKVSFISAPQLADILYQKEEGIILLDARDKEAYDTYHIPTALHHEAGDPLKTDDLSTGLDGAGTFVVYGFSGDLRIVDDFSDLPGKVYFLKGGIGQWYELVLFPDFIKNPVRNIELLRQIVDRCMFFGGRPMNTQLLNIDVRANRFREGC